jgi:hypothetical protein
VGGVTLAKKVPGTVWALYPVNRGRGPGTKNGARHLCAPLNVIFVIPAQAGTGLILCEQSEPINISLHNINIDFKYRHKKVYRPCSGLRRNDKTLL